MIPRVHGAWYDWRMPVTDPQTELFDVIDEQDRVIGQTTRYKAHRDPSLLHRSIGILVFRGDEVFLQKRSATKDTLPGLWTCSVTGHVDSGEDWLHAAKRELHEEIGIEADSDPVQIHQSILRYSYESELMRFYRYDIDANAILKLDANEIAEGKWFTVDQTFLTDQLPAMGITPCMKLIAETYLSRLIG